MSPRPRRQLRRLGGIIVGILTILALTTPSVAQEEPDSDAVTIPLTEVNESGVSGTATLTANGDQTDVAIRLTGAFGSHPNHIHENFCDEVNPDPLLPLQHIEVGEADPDGFTNSTVDIPLDELLAGEFSILVHRSDAELDDYLVCGNISTDPTEVAVAPAAAEPVAAEPTAAGPVADEPVADEPVADEPVADEPVADQPATGTGADTVAEVSTTGVGSASQGNLGLLAAIVALAGVSATIAIAAARKPRPG